MAPLPIIRLNPDARLRRETIAGDDVCVIVDDFLDDPRALIEFSVRNAAGFVGLQSGYPGLQLRVNDSASVDIVRFIRTELTKVFPFLRGGLELRTILSMVTQPPEKLTPLQRVCHIDPNPDHGRRGYAGLVYLFDNEKLGGTSFYRWRNRELMFEAADTMRADPERGLEFLQEHFATFREPPRYMTDSNDVAERIGTVPARFNRLVFYAGDVPHSGAITSPELLSSDFRTGRLTLNLFASVVPK